MQPASATFMLAALFFAGIPHAGAKTRGCDAGRFAVTAGQDVLGASILVLDGAAVTVEGACPAVGRAKPGRKGTRVAAAWDGCGAARKLRLRATARDCEALRGTMRVRGKRRRFAATASTCGDGVVDAGAGEQCDGGTSCAGCTADCRCPGGAQPLECETLGYPCSWDAVAPDVAARTWELARAAADALGESATTADAAAPIAEAGAAELIYDHDQLRFRLPNGRAAWVARRGPLGQDAASLAGRMSAHAATTSQYAASRAAAPRPPLPAPRSVLAPGQRPKRALVLSPYAFRPGEADAPIEVAAILEGIDDYAGQVAYRANVDPASRVVGLDDFGDFAGRNVVYVSTHGQMICEDLRTGKPLPCRAAIDTGIYAGFWDDSEIPAGQPGLEPFFWPEHEGAAIGVTADFFRARYPGGLADTLVWVDSCKTAGSDIAGALEGTNGNYVSWDGTVSALGAREVSTRLLAWLARGRAIHEAYAALGITGRYDPTPSDPLNAAQLLVGAQDVRIRELPRLVDAFTGATLADGAKIEITGYTSDGQPDGLLLLLDVFGASPEQGDAHTVQVIVHGTVIHTGKLATVAEYASDWRWHGALAVDLGFDVQEDQPLPLTVRVTLPEGGDSTFAVTPRASGPAFQPGKKWLGEFMRTSDTGAAIRTLYVTALFERDPDEDPLDRHPTYRMTAGELTFTLADGPTACTWSADTTVVPLGPDPDVFFRFDLDEQPVEYSGRGQTDGPLVDLKVECDGPGSTTTVTEAGGTWFSVPIEAHWTAANGAFGGQYASGGQLLTHWHWTFQRIE